jgi:hypothetical protein
MDSRGRGFGTILVFVFVLTAAIMAIIYVTDPANREVPRTPR